MYIIMKTDGSSQRKTAKRGQKAHYLCTEDLSEAKAFLDGFEDKTAPKDTWAEFNAYLKQTLFEPNKLSKHEIENLCLEYEKWAIFAQRKSYSDYFIGRIGSENRKISIGYSSSFIRNSSNAFRYYWEQLVNLVNKHTKTKNFEDWNEQDLYIDPFRDLDLKLPPINNIRNLPLDFHRDIECGALNLKFYKLIYYIDFVGIKIQNPELREFWNFYKKTMDVYAILRDYESSNLQVISKPDEMFIKYDILHCSYDSQYFCDGIEVKKEFYYADRNDLKLSDFEKINNADLRSIFIKKAGIEKFIKMGIVVDSWENYPDNEWWAKSEYKLIDMKKILIKEIRKWSTGETTDVIRYDYAPFLCMKNQTTGEYHLEGVSPDCRNLYDALKMRYKDLNLLAYEVKDIK